MKVILKFLTLQNRCHHKIRDPGSPMYESVINIPYKLSSISLCQDSPYDCMEPTRKEVEEEEEEEETSSSSPTQIMHSTNTSEDAPIILKCTVNEHVFMTSLSLGN